MPQFSYLTNRALPAAVTDNTVAPARGGRYGEGYTLPIGNGLYGLAEEGTLFVATNPTIGTGISASIQTSYAATNGLLNIRNNAGAGGVRIYPLWLRLICTTVPASATSAQIAVAIDSSIRYSSGGTQITALNNANMDSARTSSAVLWFGALTLNAASGNQRIVGRSMLASVIPVALDEYIIFFGPYGGDFGTLGGTTATRRTLSSVPIVLGPNANHNMSLHAWYPANATTAAQFEFEFCWIER